MKSLLAGLFTVLFTFTAIAADYVTADFDGVTANQDIYEMGLTHKEEALEVTPRIRELIHQSFGYEIEPDQYCQSEHIAKVEFVTPAGRTFYAVFTNEDYCDGGNSYGVVLDKNLEFAAWIFDGTYYSEKK